MLLGIKKLAVVYFPREREEHIHMEEALWCALKSTISEWRTEDWGKGDYRQFHLKIWFSKDNFM